MGSLGIYFTMKLSSGLSTFWGGERLQLQVGLGRLQPLRQSLAASAILLPLVNSVILKHVAYTGCNQTFDSEVIHLN